MNEFKQTNTSEAVSVHKVFHASCLKCKKMADNDANEALHTNPKLNPRERKQTISIQTENLNKAKFEDKAKNMIHFTFRFVTSIYETKQRKYISLANKDKC